MKSRFLAHALAFLAGLATLALAGCAAGPGGTPADGPTAGSGGSGVQVFGVIDAGVSHVTNKSSR